jgi:hypothetical protein
LLIPLLVLAPQWVSLAALGPAPVAASGIGQGEVASGGLGLARAEWEADHGVGEAGQDTVAYEDGAYTVQFRNGIVSYLEWGWAEPGVDLGTAEVAVLGMIPGDARATERFAAPPTAAGPTGLAVRRYESEALAAMAPELGLDLSGGILVIFFETPAPDRFEPNISGDSVSVGTNP